MRALHAALLAIAISSTFGCASGAPRASTGSNSNVITAEEIAAGSGSTAYEVIQRLRPRYLRTRGAVQGSPSGSTNNIEPVDVVVYVNDNRVGNSEQLRQISVSQIREIRYYSASEATTKWGTGHIAGAIQVVSR